MKREKKVLIVWIILGVVLVSIVYVIAQGQGELYTPKPAKVNVTVRASGTPPAVIYVNNVSFFQTDTSTWITAPTLITPYLATLTTNFVVYFYGYFSDGVNLLPPYSNPTPGQDVSAYVVANLSRGGKVRNKVVCRYWNTGTYAGLDVKNYTCNFTAYWSDDPRTNAWTIRIQLETDPTSGTSLWSPVNGTQTFQYGRNADSTIDIASVNWTTSPIIAGGVNAPSDNVINFVNNGNVRLLNGQLYSLRINATRLIGEKIAGTTFGASNFTASQGTSVAACSASAFSEAGWSNPILDVPTDTTPPAPRNAAVPLGFCAKTAEEVSIQSYSTSAAGGYQWVLEDFCNGCL